MSPSPEGSFSREADFAVPVGFRERGFVRSACSQLRACSYSGKSRFPPVMELWQRLGFESFGDWRRASEKARRAAKKQATSASSAAAAAACSSVSTAAPATLGTPPRVSWQPLKSLQMPLAPNSPLGFRWEQLPGRLHEHRCSGDAAWKPCAHNEAHVTRRHDSDGAVHVTCGRTAADSRGEKHMAAQRGGREASGERCARAGSRTCEYVTCDV